MIRMMVLILETKHSLDLEELGTSQFVTTSKKKYNYLIVMKKPRICEAF